MLKINKLTVINSRISLRLVVVSQAEQTLNWLSGMKGNFKVADEEVSLKASQ